MEPRRHAEIGNRKGHNWVIGWEPRLATSSRCASPRRRDGKNRDRRPIADADSSPFCGLHAVVDAEVIVYESVCRVPGGRIELSDITERSRHAPNISSYRLGGLNKREGGFKRWPGEWTKRLLCSMHDRSFLEGLVILKTTEPPHSLHQSRPLWARIPKIHVVLHRAEWGFN